MAKKPKLVTHELSFGRINNKTKLGKTLEKYV
jgi:hypothetical protein